MILLLISDIFSITVNDLHGCLGQLLALGWNEVILRFHSVGICLETATGPDALKDPWDLLFWLLLLCTCEMAELGRIGTSTRHMGREHGCMGAISVIECPKTLINIENKKLENLVAQNQNFNGSDLGLGKI